MVSHPWYARAWSAGRLFVRGLVQLVYPNTCWLCSAALPEDLLRFCVSCRHRLLGDTDATCQCCAGTVGPFVDTSEGCVHCRDEHFRFERVIRLGNYDMLREIVL